MGGIRAVPSGAGGPLGHLTPNAIDFNTLLRKRRTNVTARSRRRVDAAGGHARRERDGREDREGGAGSHGPWP